jgi:polyhydroxyalkanoate synthesis regulator phasin
MSKKMSNGKAPMGKASGTEKPESASKSAKKANAADIEEKARASIAALKKAFLIGLGATVMTAEKLRDAVKELVDDMVARGDINPAEARKVAEDLKHRFLDSKMTMEEGLRQVVDGTCRKTLETIGKATKSLEDALSASAPARNAVKKPAAKKPVKKAAAPKTAKKPAKKAVTASSATKSPSSRTSSKSPVAAKRAPRQAALKASKPLSAGAPRAAKKAPIATKKTTAARKAK